MKFKLSLIVLFLAQIGFSQSLNRYKAVQVPTKFGFQKTENQYRLSTITKTNLENAGFEAYYSNEAMPKEYDRCSILKADIKNESSLFMTKLVVFFTDCDGKTVYQTPIGKSREKEFEVSYAEALNDAFASIYAMKYKYVAPNPNVVNPVAVLPNVANPVAVLPPASDIKPNVSVDANLLYAMPTKTGFQLVDSSPKMIYKLHKTSKNDCFIAEKNGVSGILILKENNWYFEYYQNETLFSEKISVKF